jgi:nicotinate-nucleotide adenylyltransferase
MKRIGLFGGSFDPPHNAHLALARVALDHLLLDELRWVPAGDTWQKKRELAPPADRAAMVEVAIAGEPRFVLEGCELRRAGPSYTIDTLLELQVAQAGEPAEWFLVIGQDQYANLHTWHRWRELLPRTVLAVARRGDAVLHADPALAAEPHRMVALPLPRIDVSATEIRRRAADGRDYTEMVPAAVARYIDQNHLYRGTQELNGHP